MWRIVGSRATSELQRIVLPLAATEMNKLLHGHGAQPERVQARRLEHYQDVLTIAVEASSQPLHVGKVDSAERHADARRTMRFLGLGLTSCTFGFTAFLMACLPATHRLRTAPLALIAGPWLALRDNLRLPYKIEPPPSFRENLTRNALLYGPFLLMLTVQAGVMGTPRASVFGKQWKALFARFPNCPNVFKEPLGWMSRIIAQSMAITAGVEGRGRRDEHCGRTVTKTGVEGGLDGMAALRSMRDNPLRYLTAMLMFLPAALAYTPPGRARLLDLLKRIPRVARSLEASSEPVKSMSKEFLSAGALTSAAIIAGTYGDMNPRTNKGDQRTASSSTETNKG